MQDKEALNPDSPDAVITDTTLLANDQGQRGPGTGRRVDNVDLHVGDRMRIRRLYLGISQTALAEALGISHQQIQKYERGLNRISAGRLYQLSKLLKIDVAYFFDGMIDHRQSSNEPEQANIADTNGQTYLPELQHQAITAAIVDLARAIRESQSKQH